MGIKHFVFQSVKSTVELGFKCFDEAFKLGEKQEKSPVKVAKRDSFWLNQYNGEQNSIHISNLHRIAEESNIKIHALALQFVLSFDWVASTIIGCSTVEQCGQNFMNTSILDKKILKKINKLHKQRMPPCN